MPIRRPPDYALIRRSRRARRIPLLPLAALFALVLAATAILLLSRWALSPAPEEGAHAKWAYVLDGQTPAGERSSHTAKLLAAGILDSAICGGNSVGGELWGSTLSARRVLSLSQADPARVAEFRLTTTSTLEEARALVPLFRALAADTIALVTSNYHTRRALSVFRRVAGGNPAFIAYAAQGPDFPTPWWRSRIGRRTWLVETTKNAYWHLFEKWIAARLPDDAAMPHGAFVRAPEAGALPGAAPCPAQPANLAAQPAAIPAATADVSAARPDSQSVSPAAAAVAAEEFGTPAPVRPVGTTTAPSRSATQAAPTERKSSVTGTSSARKAASGEKATAATKSSASGRKTSGTAKQAGSRAATSSTKDKKR